MSGARASVVPLPGAATEKVRQPRLSGRDPSIVVRLLPSHPTREALAQRRNEEAVLRKSIELSESQVAQYEASAQAMRYVVGELRKKLNELRPSTSS
jgi:hypothetical protein